MKFFSLAIAFVIAGCAAAPSRTPSAVDAKNLKQFGYTPYLCGKYTRASELSLETAEKMADIAVAQDQKHYKSLKKKTTYDEFSIPGKVKSVEPDQNRWKLPCGEAMAVRGTKGFERYLALGEYIFREPWIAGANVNLRVYQVKNEKLVGTQSFSQFAADAIAEPKVTLIRQMGEAEALMWETRDVAGLVQGNIEREKLRHEVRGFGFPVLHFNVGRVFYEDEKPPKTMTFEVPTGQFREWARKGWAIIGFYDETEKYGGIEIALTNDVLGEVAALLGPGAVK